MTNLDYVLHGWNANPLVLLGLVAAAAAYARFVGRHGRPALFVAALALVAFALLSPLNLLATGVLFSAHMAQHILLLLLVPGLVLLSLPPRWRLGRRAGRDRGRAMLPALGWALGVGSMWFWHVPQFCDAAASNGSVHAAQTLSLLGMGAVFWWPILAPNPAERLLPGHGIIYLFTACLACTALGILLTLTPVEVCPVFAGPTQAPAMWSDLRTALTAHRDQQIGGLLMWLPMCLVYVGAIVLELARWLGEPPGLIAPTKESSS